MYYENCPNCFSGVDPSGVCGVCGYDQEKARKFEGVIEPMNILNARYLTGRVLGRGGFGVTYLAKDMVTNTKVAIKECMPESYAVRVNETEVMPKKDEDYAFGQCKENFRQESGALFDLRHNPFVVNVSNYFSEKIRYVKSEKYPSLPKPFELLFLSLNYSVQNVLMLLKDWCTLSSNQNTENFLRHFE